MCRRSKDLGVPFVAVALLLMALPACAGEAVSPAVEQTQAHTAAAAGATDTPEPTPTSPAPILGIDEPMVVEDITVEDSLGLTTRGDLELLITDAYTEESRQSGDSPPVYPDDPLDVFLTLEFDLDGPANSIRWVAANTRLACGEEEYRAGMIGLRVEEGVLAGWHIVFTVPKDSEVKECELRLLDGRTIELAALFE